METKKPGTYCVEINKTTSKKKYRLRLFFCVDIHGMITVAPKGYEEFIGTRFKRFTGSLSAALEPKVVRIRITKEELDRVEEKERSFLFKNKQSLLRENLKPSINLN